MHDITLVPELVINIGEECNHEHQQMKVVAQVQISSETHSDGHTELTGVVIQRIWSIELCGNKLNESAHEAIQMWLERDFTADMRESYLYAAVIEKVEGCGS